MAPATVPSGYRLVFEDDFTGDALDHRVWFPHYLPAWSSRAESAADYEVVDSCLVLSIPPGKGFWLPGEHSPLRVSAVQTGNWSGEVGSIAAQQTYRPGAQVAEQQEQFWGLLPRFGYLQMRARAEISPRSMVAWWMIGRELDPAESAEICVFEIFGDAVVPEVSAEVGMGLHAFRDPRIVEDFTTTKLPIDVAEFHTYGVDWRPGRVDFFVDGEHVRTSLGPPEYPMQLMVAVFDFPSRSVGADAGLTPQLVVDWVRGYVRDAV